MGNKHLVHLKSVQTVSDGTTVSPKLPNPEDLYYGELAVNFRAGSETISMKNDSDDIVKFVTDTKVNTMINNKVRISTSSVTRSTNNLQPATTSNLEAGQQMHVIYVNMGSDDYTISFVTTYKTPDGQPLTLTCPNGGYCEANFIKVGNNIYARGL